MWSRRPGEPYLSSCRRAGGTRPPLSPFRIPPTTPPAKSKFLSDQKPINNGSLTVRKTQTERAAMKPATPAIPSTLRPANGGAALFGHPRFSLRCAASKNQFSVRTACVTSLLPLLLLLLLLTLPAVVQAQFTYTTINGAITITGGNCFDGAVAIRSPTASPASRARCSLAAPA